MKKREKGITLIALVITIIVLLILAGVTISTLTGENGIITRTTQAADKTGEANAEEQVQLAVAASIETDGNINNEDLKDNLNKIEGIEGVPETITDDSYPLTVTVDGYEVMINKNGQTSKTTASTVEEAKNENVVFSENTQITDSYGNYVEVPAGFKIASDSGDTVNEGIVIEDVNNGGAGNQFVWIPIGDIYTDEERTEENKVTIELNRYSFASDGTPSVYTDYYVEYEKDTDDSLYGNAIAKDLEDFKEKAVQSNGYYIGRYEVGITEDTPVVQKNQQVYNSITQKDASEVAQNMYQNKTFESDLMNSYAFDTAIVFIQTFGTDEFSKKYSVQSGQDINNSIKNTGMSQLYYNDSKEDKQCNIYDLAGNCVEWLTTTCARNERTLDQSVIKGGTAHGYSVMGGPDSTYNANFYYTYTLDTSHEDIGFRIVLYL